VLTGDTESDVLRYASETTMRLAPRVTRVPHRAATELALGDAEEWVRLDGIRYSPGGEKIGIVAVYLRAEHATIATEMEQPVQQAIYSHLLERLGLQLWNIDQRIGATALTAAEARRLGAQAGEPALKILRRFNSAPEQPIEVSVQVHPASRFEYSLSIEPMQDSLPRAEPRRG